MTKTFTYTEAETAMCIYDWWSIILAAESSRTGHWRRRWEGLGQAGMRFTALTLAPKADELWIAHGDPDAITWDTEYVHIIATMVTEQPLDRIIEHVNYDEPFDVDAFWSEAKRRLEDAIARSKARSTPSMPAAPSRSSSSA